jgi:hypothetical protein
MATLRQRQIFLNVMIKVLRSYLFGLKGHREGRQNFDDYFIQFMWKDRVFAIQSTAHWLGMCGTNLCANIN